MVRIKRNFNTWCLRRIYELKIPLGSLVECIYYTMNPHLRLSSYCFNKYQAIFTRKLTCIKKVPQAGLDFYMLFIYQAFDFSSLLLCFKENLILSFSLSRSAINISPCFTCIERISSASGSSRYF